jgi:hypothetical protein
VRQSEIYGTYKLNRITLQNFNRIAFKSYAVTTKSSSKLIKKCGHNYNLPIVLQPLQSLAARAKKCLKLLRILSKFYRVEKQTHRQHFNSVRIARGNKINEQQSQEEGNASNQQQRTVSLSSWLVS